MKQLHDSDARFREALDRLLELAVLLDADMTADLAARGLTRARTHLLWVLEHSGPSTQRTLADALEVSPRNVTGLVDALADTGFVTREPHPSDRRATLVTLTAQGRAVTEQLVREHHGLAEALFAAMPARRFDAFAAGLEDVVGTLRELTAREPEPEA